MKSSSRDGILEEVVGRFCDDFRPWRSEFLMIPLHMIRSSVLHITEVRDTGIPSGFGLRLGSSFRRALYTADAYPKNLAGSDDPQDLLVSHPL